MNLIRVFVEPGAECIPHSDNHPEIFLLRTFTEMPPWAGFCESLHDLTYPS